MTNSLKQPENNVGPEKAPSTNREFLEFVFGEGAWVWGTSFANDPKHAAKKFKGRCTQLPAMPINDSAEICNTYFCCARLREISYQRQRKEQFFDGLAVLMLDDVGEKGKALEEICEVLTPTYVIHTSNKEVDGQTVPSYQVGYVFESPVTDRKVAERLLKNLAAREGDRSGNNLVRVARLPFGMNTSGSKPTDGSTPRPSNKVRLHNWSGRKYTPEQVIEEFGVQELSQNVVPLGPTAFSRPTYLGDSALGNEFVEEGDVIRKLTLEEVEEALSFIDPGVLPYDGNDPDSSGNKPHWLGIIMAIHSEFPGEDGKALADEWSRRGGNRYDPGEVERRWPGFGEKSGYTVGTIIKFALEGGWKPGNGVTERDKLLAKWGKDYAVVRFGNKVRVLVENKEAGHTPEQNPYDLYTFEDFKKWKATQRFKDPLDGKNKLLAVVWFNRPYRREFQGIGCYPPGSHGAPKGFYNSWRGFAVEPKPGDCSLWKKHALEVYCSGNQEHFDWIWKWLAALVKQPGNPVGTALACRGEQGTGKGAFWHPMIKIFGSHCVQFIDQKQMDSQFTGLLEGKVLVLNNEAYWGGNTKASGKLKGLITEKYVASERKGIEAQTVFNPLWFGFQSNSAHFIPAEKGSRRFMATEISSSHKQDAEYFRPLFSQLKDGGVEALLYELLQTPLSADDLQDTLRNPPVTRALLEQVSRTHEDFASWVQQLALDGELPEVREAPAQSYYFRSKHAFEDFVEFRRRAGLYPKTKGHNEFGRRLSELGVPNKKPRLVPGGGQTRSYEFPPLSKFRRVVQDTYPCEELDDFDESEEWRPPHESLGAM
ncbi:MAG: DUF5906 domain-containing protein [Pseudomonadota bacterium]